MVNAFSSKEEWRTLLLARRMALSNTGYAKKSLRITTRLHQLSCLQEARTIHVYWPLIARQEVDTRPFITAVYEAGKRVVLPVVKHYRRQITHQPRLHHHLYAGSTSLSPSKWGIPEPAATPLVGLPEIDAVIVPALGADRHGVRLGHGWGFYDEFLMGLAVPKICLVFDTCLVSRLPMSQNDVKMTHIITEAETICLPSV